MVKTSASVCLMVSCVDGRIKFSRDEHETDKKCNSIEIVHSHSHAQTGRVWSSPSSHAVAYPVTISRHPSTRHLHQQEQPGAGAEAKVWVNNKKATHTAKGEPWSEEEEESSSRNGTKWNNWMNPRHVLVALMMRCEGIRIQKGCDSYLCIPRWWVVQCRNCCCDFFPL